MVSGIFTVLLFQKFPENAERDGRFQRRAGFGNDVHVKVPAAQFFQRVAERVGRKAVSYKEHFRITAAGNRAQQLNRTAGTQVGTADADDDERLGAGTDFVSSGNDAVQFRILDGFRQMQPAGKVCAETAAGGKHLVRTCHSGKVRTGFGKEALCTG